MKEVQQNTALCERGRLDLLTRLRRMEEFTREATFHKGQ